MSKTILLIVCSIFVFNINHTIFSQQTTTEKSSIIKFRVNLGELEKLGKLENQLNAFDKKLAEASYGDEAVFYALLKDKTDTTFSIYQFIPCFTKEFFYHPTLKIKFKPENFITTTNDYNKYNLSIDFNDSKGERTINTTIEQEFNIQYTNPGNKKIIVTLTNKTDESDKIITEISWNITFKKNETDGQPKANYTLPNFTLNIIGGTSYISPCEGNQGVSRGKAHVLYAQGNNQLTQPVVFVEGIDFSDAVVVESSYHDTLRFGNFGWDRFMLGMPGMEMLPQIVDSLTLNGYDVVLLDFVSGADYIQKNADLFIQLIRILNDSIIANGNSCPSIDVIGTSMGGIVSRYGIMKMEQSGYQHRIKNFISFDSPQRGANIPLSIQAFAHFIGVQGGNAGALQSWNKLNAPAARQLVRYHMAYYPSNSNCMFDDLYNELDAYGLPRNTTWNVGVANGSGIGTKLPFNAGDFLLDCDFDPWYVSASMVAKMYASNGRVFSGNHKFFKGKFDDTPLIPWDAIEDDYYLPPTTPLTDNAPGGLTDVIEADIIPSITASISADNINTYQPVNSFIPTISALAIPVPWTQLHDTIAGGSLETLIPFDDYYFPNENQMHVEVTTDNLNFIFSKIKRTLPLEYVHDTICNGETFVFNGTPYTNQGTYTNFIKNQHGCDSINTTIYLSVLTSPNFVVTASSTTANPGDFITLSINGTDYIGLEWTLPGGIMTTSHSPQIIFPNGQDSVVVNVSVYNQNCTINDHIVIYNNTLSINKIKDEKIRIFPNPIFNGELIIEANFSLKEITIYDVLGKIVLQTSTEKNNTTLDLNNLSNGIYRLELMENETKKTFQIQKM